MELKLGVLTCKDLPEFSPDCVFGIEALRRRGVHVVPLIWDEVPVGALESFDGVLVRSLWDYQRKLAPFQAWLAEVERRGVRMMNPAELISWNLSKRYLSELDSAADVPVVPTLWVGRDESVSDEWVRALPWGRLVVKPEISASGDLTVPVAREDTGAVLAAIRSAQGRCDVMIQPFCESIASLGEISLVYFWNGREGRFSHAVRKVPAAGKFLVHHEYGGQYSPITASSEHLRLAERVLKHLPAEWLYARVDIVECEGTPRLGEAELFEPQLYFRWAPAEAAELFAECVIRSIRG